MKNVLPLTTIALTACAAPTERMQEPEATPFTADDLGRGQKEALQNKFHPSAVLSTDKKKPGSYVGAGNVEEVRHAYDRLSETVRVLTDLSNGKNTEIKELATELLGDTKNETHWQNKLAKAFDARAKSFKAGMSSQDLERELSLYERFNSSVEVLEQNNGPVRTYAVVDGDNVTVFKVEAKSTDGHKLLKPAEAGSKNALGDFTSMTERREKTNLAIINQYLDNADNLGEFLEPEQYGLQNSSDPAKQKKAKETVEAAVGKYLARVRTAVEDTLFYGSGRDLFTHFDFRVPTGDNNKSGSWGAMSRNKSGDRNRVGAVALMSKEYDLATQNASADRKEYVLNTFAERIVEATEHPVGVAPARNGKEAAHEAVRTPLDEDYMNSVVGLIRRSEFNGDAACPEKHRGQPVSGLKRLALMHYGTFERMRQGEIAEKLTFSGGAYHGNRQ